MREHFVVGAAFGKRLDAHEVGRGAAEGRPRVKETRVEEMLEIIRRGRGE